MKGSVKPQLPCDTRWNSIETFIKNRTFMLLITAQDKDAIDPRIRNLIHNIGLVNEAKHLQKQLGPVSKALDRLQSDSSYITDACEVWVK